MKVNFNYIFVFFLTILLASLGVSPAFAQDENNPVENEYKDLTPSADLNDDRSSLSEHERSVKQRDMVRDSSHMRAGVSFSSQKTKATEQAKPSAAKDEDALSFNFLYYIIQKFKISDLVDEDQ